MKIFIALGSQKFQLNRLLQEVDACADHPKAADWEVFAQIGYSSYLPKKFAYTRFMSKDTYISHITNADLLIIHGGAGTIMEGLEHGKRIVVYPRKASFHEHIDDHQSQIASEFEKRGYVVTCNGGNLMDVIDRAVEFEFSPFHPVESRIPGMLRSFIEECTVR